MPKKQKIINNMNKKRQLDNVKNNGIIYSINKEEKTACVVDFENIDLIIIPYSIIIESTEYIVTSIFSDAFFCSKIKSIKLPNNSLIDQIENESFSSSLLETITISPQVVKFGKRSFSSCRHLKHVEISIDSKLQLIEKESFFYSSIRSIKIPKSVSKIGERTFCYCRQLKEIEIPKDSQLQTIGEYAFHATSIENFTIP